MHFSISEEVRSVCPGAVLGILHYKANVEPVSPALLQAFDAALARLAAEYQMDTIAKNPHIAATRSAYKALGKSPHEYRNAAEACWPGGQAIRAVPHQQHCGGQQLHLGFVGVFHRVL